MCASCWLPHLGWVCTWATLLDTHEQQPNCLQPHMFPAARVHTRNACATKLQRVWSAHKVMKCPECPAPPVLRNNGDGPAHMRSQALWCVAAKPKRLMCRLAAILHQSASHSCTAPAARQPAMCPPGLYITYHCVSHLVTRWATMRPFVYNHPATHSICCPTSCQARCCLQHVCIISNNATSKGAARGTWRYNTTQHCQPYHTTLVQAPCSLPHQHRQHTWCTS